MAFGQDEILARLAAELDASWTQSFKSATESVNLLKESLDSLSSSGSIDGLKSITTSVSSLSKGTGAELKSIGEGLAIIAGAGKAITSNIVENIRDLKIQLQELGKLGSSADVVQSVARSVQGIDARAASAARNLGDVNEALIRLEGGATGAAESLPAMAAGVSEVGVAARNSARGMNEASQSTKKLNEGLSGLRFDTSIGGFLRLAGAQLRFILAGNVVFSTVNKLIESVGRLGEVSTAVARTLTVFTSGLEEAGRAQVQLQQLILRTSSVFGTSIKETSDALFELGSAGLSLRESTAALTPVLNLAVGTVADMGEVAKTVAGIYKVFGNNISGAATEQEKFTKITDVLASAFKVSLVETQDLVQGLKFIGATGSAAGLTFEQLTASLTVMNDNMLKSGLAGRGLRSAFTTLIAKADDLKAAFGVTFELGNFQSLIGLLQQIKTNLDSTDKTIKGGTLTNLAKIFGNEAAPAVILLANNIQKLQQNTDLFTNSAAGTAEAMRKIQTESLSGRLKILNESFQNLVVSSLAPFGELLRLILGPINTFLQAVNSMNDALGGIPAIMALAAGGVLLLNAALNSLIGSFSVFAVAAAPVEAVVTEFGVLFPAAATDLGLLSGALGAASGAVKTFAAASVAFLATPAGLIATAGAIFVFEAHKMSEASRALAEEATRAAGVRAQIELTASNQIVAARSKELDSLEELSGRQGRLRDALAESLAATNQVVGADANLVSTQFAEAQAAALVTEALVDNAKAALGAARARQEIAAARAFQTGTGKEFVDEANKLIHLREEMGELSVSIRGVEKNGRDFSEAFAQTGNVLDALGASIANLLVGGGLHKSFDEAKASAEAAGNKFVELVDKFGGLAKVSALAPLETIVALQNLTEEQKKTLAVNEELRISNDEFVSSVKQATIAIDLQAEANKVLAEALKTTRDITDETSIAAAKNAQALRDVNTASAAELVSSVQSTEKQIQDIKSASLDAQVQATIDAENKNIEIISKKAALEKNLNQGNAQELARIEAQKAADLQRGSLQSLAQQQQIEAQRVKLTQERISAEVQRETQAKEKIKSLTVDLAQAEQNTLNNIEAARRRALAPEEAFARLQSDILKNLKQGQSFSPFDVGGLERSKAALQEAAKLVGELPDKVVDANGKVIASEKDVADLRDSLQRKLDRANESLIRNQISDQQGAADAATTAAEEQTTALETQKAKVIDLQGQMKSLADSIKATADQSIVDAIGKEGTALNNLFSQDTLDKQATWLGKQQDITKELTKGATEADRLAEALRKIPDIPSFGVQNPNFGGVRWGGKNPGFGGGDIIPMMTEPGEGFIRKEIVRSWEMKFGEDVISRINRNQAPDGLFGEDGKPRRGGDTIVFAPVLNPETLRHIKGMEPEEVTAVVEELYDHFEKTAHKRKGRKL